MAMLPAVGRVSSSRGTLTRSGVTKYHAGWDITGTRGDQVVAPEAGVVVARWTDDVTKPYSGYGPGGIVIAGDSGFFHLLAHLQPDSTPILGSTVGEGDQVGTMSSANHVHWEVRTQPALTRGKTNEDITADPADWLTAHAPTMPVVRPPPPPTTPAKRSSAGVWLLLLLLLGARRWKS